MTTPAHRLPLAPQDRAKTLTPRWDHRKYGTLDDPAHKSHMSTLLGEFSCTEQFRRDRLRELTGEQRDTLSGKTEFGTAGHETIARALRSPNTLKAVLAGTGTPSIAQVRSVVLQEFEHVVRGKQVAWYGKAEQDDVHSSIAWMCEGLFRELHWHVAAVELVESGFIAQLGDIFVEGHTDLVYRPTQNPEALALTDWKTGAHKPNQIELDHGYEGGFYSLALERGLFLPIHVLQAWRDAKDNTVVPLDAEDRALLSRASSDREAMHVALRGIMRRNLRDEPIPEGVRFFGQFPELIYQTHLADYVPYERKGNKTIERPEDLEHWSRITGAPRQAGDKVSYEKGMTRGGAWMRVKRSAEDITRLEKMLRTVVGWVRFGKFVPAVSEKCNRCSYRGPCLTDGYELRGEAAKELNAALRGLDLDGSDLSTDD
jgi:hypothetical protein